MGVPVRPSESASPTPTQHVSKPVLLWALFGTIFSGIAIVGWARWIGSDYFTPSPTGPDEFGGWRLVYLRCWEFGTFGLSLWFFWRYLVRPVLTERRLTLDGMIIVGFLLTWFYDPLPNLNVWTFTYNAHLINMGSWTAFIPFWAGPNSEHHPEPLLLIGGAYMAWFFFIPMLTGSWFIKRVRARFGWSNLGAFSALWCVLMVVELALFGLLTYPEVMQFPGAVHSMSLFAGKPYQYPIYDCVLAAFLFCTYAAFHYFRDDKGRSSFVEMGVDTLRVKPWCRTVISTLAVAGFCQVTLIFVYLVPYQQFAQRADATPLMKSYMNPGVCGKGTDYACPDAKVVPIPSKSSIHITPDDPRLPAGDEQPSLTGHNNSPRG